MKLLLIAVALTAVSGVPGFVVRRAGAWIATVLMLLGAGTGIGVVVAHWGATMGVARDWFLPLGRFSVELDAVGGFFLVPVFLIPALGSIYGLGYWTRPSGRKLRAYYGTMTAAMAMVVLARDSVLFLIAWEAMALSAFFLVTTEDEEPQVQQASWIYLIAAHVGTLALFALFGLLWKLTGSSDLGPAGDLAAKHWIFALALAGFGLKAGLMPFHVWLPGAHANAPSHVSAVLSGVMIKMGVYGFVRIGTWVSPAPSWWGATLFVLGAVSGILGLAFALGQHDFKRTLAYSSIENVGIILIGLGLSMMGRTHGRPDWIALGLGGALLHAWNHSLFKPLLFFAAGAVHHATGTREMDRLGGVAKSMPGTATAALVGAVAICGLPPLNGFFSEILLYVGLIRAAGAGAGAWVAVGAPALAMIGALAIAVFVRTGGAVFLGSPRSSAAGQAHEAPASMLGPMAVLGLLCIVTSAGSALVPVLLPGPSVAPFVPLRRIGAAGAGLIALLGLALAVQRLRFGRTTAAVGTWDCGFAKPTPRIQYTGSSYAEALVGLFRWVLRPVRQAPRLGDLFPGSAHFKAAVPDLVLDRILVPGSKQIGRILQALRLLQQGRIQVYLLYILATAVLLLLLGGTSC